MLAFEPEDHGPCNVFRNAAVKVMAEAYVRAGVASADMTPYATACGMMHLMGYVSQQRLKNTTKDQSALQGAQGPGERRARVTRVF